MHSFDKVWDEIYERGHANRYPWDAVVSFVFRHHPRGRPRQDVQILEIGCGGGNNLLFCAKEGFSVTGVDASAKALNFAKTRFHEEGLHGSFLMEDFTRLSLSDKSVDLVIDRASLTCTPLEVMTQAISEIKRVLKPGGRFLFIPYADTHSSAGTGVFDSTQRMVADITAGTLVGVGQISFVSLNDIKMLFPAPSWRFIQIERAEHTNLLNAVHPIHAEYRVVVERLEN